MNGEFSDIRREIKERFGLEINVGYRARPWGKPGMEEAGVMKAWFFLHMYNAEYGGLGGVAHW